MLGLSIKKKEISDAKKPICTTIISQENFKKIFLKKSIMNVGIKKHSRNHIK